LFAGCNGNDTSDSKTVVFYDTPVLNSPARDTLPVKNTPAQQVGTIQNADREQIVRFAETLIGVPYRYASSDPATGFDCSGFITYVFSHFNVKVPRSSIDFTNVGREVHLPDAKRGDLILFTGTDSTERFVGHMGIVTENQDTLKFIHSSSGKVYGVTITPLNKYYQGRFVKVIDIF
jgi:cell wall-associated NlpC family hydrolase